MPRITPESLLTLEAYDRQRQAFRETVMAHKRKRKAQLGDHMTLIFEDELTVRYQIQEMLRIERIFEDDRVQDELDAYNSLIPDGKNLKATMMLEYPEPDARQFWLERLIGIEDKVWIQVEGCEKSWSIADEDLDRENDKKTSSVHFLRFELGDKAIGALKHGATISIGVDHPSYRQSSSLPPETSQALAADLA